MVSNKWAIRLPIRWILKHKYLCFKPKNWMLELEEAELMSQQRPDATSTNKLPTARCILHVFTCLWCSCRRHMLPTTSVPKSTRRKRPPFLSFYLTSGYEASTWRTQPRSWRSLSFDPSSKPPARLPSKLEPIQVRLSTKDRRFQSGRAAGTQKFLSVIHIREENVNEY